MEQFEWKMKAYEAQEIPIKVLHGENTKDYMDSLKTFVSKITTSQKKHEDGATIEQILQRCATIKNGTEEARKISKRQLQLAAGNGLSYLNFEAQVFYVP
jgi:hypothetical protein